jgi:DNA topoisomerase-2
MSKKQKVSHEATPEDEFRVMHPVEHILARPDMYLGSVEPEPTVREVISYDGDGPTIETVKITVPPGFLNIVDEVVCNSQDHQKRDVGVTKIALDVNAETGEITVHNNGKRTVPTSLFEDTDKTVAEVVFGTPLSGSNFSGANRSGIGKNGIGVKVANIYSKVFQIELQDPANKTHYRQTWRDNMSVCERPIATKTTLKTAETTVKFVPDYERFQISLPLDPNLVAVLRGRAFDVNVTMPSKVNVLFNGTQVPTCSIPIYANMLGGTVLCHDKVEGTLPGGEKGGDKGEGKSGKPGREKGSTGMEICVVVDAPTTRHSSFVNGRRCKGKILDLVFTQLSDVLSKKFPKATRMNSLVKDYLSVVVSATVVNPDFESQCKAMLTTPVSKLGFSWSPGPTLVKKICDSSFRGVVEASIANKTDKESHKAIKSKKNVSCKYQKPLKLGKKQCDLFICEGNSAQQMVVSGFRKIGRDYNGVYPLKGKVLNTQDLTIDAALKNTELLDIIHILGIDPRVEYTAESVKKLPFKSVIILCDQDHDGFHITGLVTVFFKKFFPSILKHNPCFLRRFVTPIVKARDPKTKVVESFFSLQAFEEWNRGRGATDCQYYKGLGTSSDKEAIAYFSDMSKHSAHFRFVNTECDALLRTWFSSDASDERKRMIREIDHDLCIDYDTPIISVSDFCNKELVHWSYANVSRTIPGIDGLKPGQRKVMYTLFQDKRTKTYKVVELAASVIGVAKFHHGEASLQESIAHMIQDYIGTNQVALLSRLSQSGSRDDPPSEHAAPRYTNTRLAEIARYLMVPDDDDVLDRVHDEGVTVEPACYATTIPLTLVNGCHGVGTGFSTDVPEYGLEDVVRRCVSFAKNGHIDDFEPLTPKPHDFVGTVVQVSPTEFQYHGIAEVTDPRTVTIRELPPQMWTNKCKEKLEALKNVKEVNVHSTGITAHLTVHVDDPSNTEACFQQVRKLIVKTVRTTNMHVFDAAGVLIKYSTPEEVFLDHARFKLATCERRRASQIVKLQSKIDLSRAKHEYIRLILSGSIVVLNAKRASLLQKIDEHGLKPFQTNLLHMPLTSVTWEESEALKREVEDLEAELHRVQSQTPNDLWLRDLDDLSTFLEGRGNATGKSAPFEG